MKNQIDFVTLHLWFLWIRIVDKVSTFFIDTKICQMDEVVADNIWIICVLLSGKPEIKIIKSRQY